MKARVCHCGHDISTHYKEKHTCLGMLCDCPEYRDRDIPLPKPKPIPKPTQNDWDDLGVSFHPPQCTCTICQFRFGYP